MAKFAVEGNTLVVGFQFGEKSIAGYKTLRISLSSVASVSVETGPWEWLTQRVKFARRRPSTIDVMMGDDFHGPGAGASMRPEVSRHAYLNGAWVLLAGPPEAQVFARIDPHLLALWVDLTEAVPYIGFLVAHRDAWRAAADLRAAISR